MADEYEFRDDFEDLSSGDPQVVAKATLETVMAAYFTQMDFIGTRNAEKHQETGEWHINMLELMVGTLMTHIVNVFYRTNAENYDLLVKELTDFVQNAPRLAEEAQEFADGNQTGHG